MILINMEKSINYITIFLGICFFFTALFYFIVPIWILFVSWAEFQLSILFGVMAILGYILAILIGLVYVRAMFKCFYNARKSNIDTSIEVIIFSLVSLLVFEIIFLTGILNP